MIYLDTNILILAAKCSGSVSPELVTWLQDGNALATSSIAWSEFCNGPISIAQKIAMQELLNGGITSFDQVTAELAAKLYNIGGRKRGSHADCMIAATAIQHKQPLATNNIKDFNRFTPHGLKLEEIAS